MGEKRSKDSGGEKAKFRYSWCSSSSWNSKGKGSMVLPGTCSVSVFPRNLNFGWGPLGGLKLATRSGEESRVYKWTKKKSKESRVTFCPFPTCRPDLQFFPVSHVRSLVDVGQVFACAASPSSTGLNRSNGPETG